MESIMTTYGVKVISTTFRIQEGFYLDYMEITKTANKVYQTRDGNYMDNHRGLVIGNNTQEVKGKSNQTLGTNKCFSCFYSP